jgi:hypothetical protein
VDVTLEQFFSLLFDALPEKSYFFTNTIFKSVQEARPRFTRDWNDIIAALKEQKEGNGSDFYFSPVAYHRPTRAIKSNVRGGRFAWVDCDGGQPVFESEPTIIVSTSVDHFHAYWDLGRLHTGPELESINRALAYKYNLDKSGWDSTQLLRPPGSFNRKRDNFRSVLSGWNPNSIHDFSDLAPPSDSSSEEVTGGTPGSLEAILAGEVFTQRVLDLIFRKEVADNGEGRSGVVFQTACELVQMRLLDDKILSILKFQDTRLRKFVAHADQEAVLRGVIKAGREKVKLPVELVIKANTKPLYEKFHGNKAFFENVANDENFVLQGFLPEEGILVIGGEPGSGKSRFVLNMTDCIATGQPFLGRLVPAPAKVAYLSLDMPKPRVKAIRRKQAQGFKDHEDLLEENVLLMIRGSGLDLTMPDYQKRISDDLDEFEAEVFVIDILGRAVPSLNDDVKAQELLNWLQEMGRSFILVSHTRKMPAGTKPNNVLDDFFGSRHWSMTPDTCLILADYEGEKHNLFVLKDRTGGLPEKIIVEKKYDMSLYTLFWEEQKGTEEKEIPPVGTVNIPGGKNTEL